MMPLPYAVAASLLVLAALILLVPVSAGLERLGDRSAPRFALPDLARVRALAARSHRRFVLLSSAGAAGPGLLAGGPVAALVCAMYAALIAHVLAESWASQRLTADRVRDLDDLSAQAADLRAGAGHFVPLEGRLGQLANAAGHLADRMGAPAADLLERIEADARAADRITAKAAAEAAGTRATALLLAVLPLAGIALGYGIGADPLNVLLHTPIGAACAITSAALQAAGVLWAERLTRGQAG